MKKKTKKPARKKQSAAKLKAPTANAASTVDPDRAEAATEVLQAVWLSEKHFELENEIVREGVRPVVTEDAEGHLWVTVKLHVPALDIDCWLDGTHSDHPDNQSDDDKDDA
jgi:hypothetical protein